jgi:hypothetical protein
MGQQIHTRENIYKYYPSFENIKGTERMGNLRRDERTISELKIGSETVGCLT